MIAQDVANRNPHGVLAFDRNANQLPKLHASLHGLEVAGGGEVAGEGIW